MKRSKIKTSLLDYTNKRIIELQRELDKQIAVINHIDNEEYIVVGDFTDDEYRLVTIGDIVRSKYGDIGKIIHISKRDGALFEDVTIHNVKYDVTKGEYVEVEGETTLTANRFN